MCLQSVLCVRELRLTSSLPPCCTAVAWLEDGDEDVMYRRALDASGSSWDTTYDVEADGSVQFEFAVELLEANSRPGETTCQCERSDVHSASVPLPLVCQSRCTTTLPMAT